MTGKVYLITGASSGIGHAAAKALLQRGHTVYAAARRLEPMTDLVAAGATAIHMDVTDEASVQAGVARVVAEQGRIDGLLANAGYLHMGMIENVSIDAAQRQFDVNVFGVARAVKAVLPHMRAQGRGNIAITSSGLGKFSAPGMAWYPASKHALEAFSDALRMEVKRFGIKVAILEPAFLSTDLFEAGEWTLDAADQAEYADVYAAAQANFRANARRRFQGGSPAETVVKPIVKALESGSPRRRYRPGWMSKWGVFAKEKIGDVVVDPISDYIWLREASPDPDLEPDRDQVERELSVRTTTAENP
jgi:NAD(P)-dependent dehydrogenase (short-subunit alcohol dehydrogenase family)